MVFELKALFALLIFVFELSSSLEMLIISKPYFSKNLNALLATISCLFLAFSAMILSSASISDILTFRLS